MKEKKVELKVLGITFSQVQAGAYALVLAEENGTRRIPIIIGTPEAQSIAIFLEGLHPPRPLTHDLFITFAHTLDVFLQEVYIYKYEDGVFFSELTFINGDKNIQIDSRTSDAIALAIRTNATIYTNEAIMKEMSIVMEEDSIIDELSHNPDRYQTSMEDMNMDELQNALNEAIMMEDYEKASYLRDLIKKRQ